MAESRRFMRHRDGDIDRATGKPFVYDFNERGILNLGLIECTLSGEIIDPNKQTAQHQSQRANTNEMSGEGSGENSNDQQTSSEEDKSAAQKMREYRVSSLVEVMKNLPKDEALYTEDGSGPPKVSVLNKALEEVKASLKVPIGDVRSEERDEAWARFNKQKAH